jgi:hypothetical protein
MNIHAKFSTVLLVAVLVCIQLSSAQKCLTAKVVANFNASQFAGRWYFVNRYFAINSKTNLGSKITDQIAAINGNCSIFDLKYNSNNQSLHVDVQTILNGKVMQKGIDDKDIDGNISWKLTIVGCKNLI